MMWMPDIFLCRFLMQMLLPRKAPSVQIYIWCLKWCISRFSSFLQKLWWIENQTKLSIADILWNTRVPRPRGAGGQRLWTSSWLVRILLLSICLIQRSLFVSYRQFYLSDICICLIKIFLFVWDRHLNSFPSCVKNTPFINLQISTACLKHKN